MTLPSLLSLSPPGQVDKLAKDFSTLGLSLPHEEIEVIKNKTSITESGVVDDPVAQAIQKELEMYRDEHYGSIDHYYFTVTKPEKSCNEEILQIATYAERIDETNFYSGSWRGEWTVRQTDDDFLLLEGSVQIHVYCHENSNVQLQTKKTFPKTNIRYEEIPAKTVKKKIASFESEVQMDLREDLFGKLDDKLKALRRVLPVMRTRMDWNVLSHRMVKKLEESASPSK